MFGVARFLLALLIKCCTEFFLHVHAIFSANLTPWYNYPTFFDEYRAWSSLYADLFTLRYGFREFSFTFSFCLNMVFNDAVNCWKKFNFGDGWLNECGSLVEWCWQGKTKYSEKSLSQCYIVHHKSHIDLPRRKLSTWREGKTVWSMECSTTICILPFMGRTKLYTHANRR